ncbi:pilus assembly protein PilR [Pectobacterium carotovorum]|uniref:type II secretion system F family protein n=1 Tax=Pectobacterium versatile TaxID=2488639 RepID=UPI000C7F2463|nr:type II secretion system F family protein [Pectobacterium versatile]PLY35840.1 pilus assembly protein PilR [Pectobacterium carotovorum]
MKAHQRFLFKSTLNARDRIELYDNFKLYAMNNMSVKDIFDNLIRSYSREGKKPKSSMAMILRECAAKYKEGGGGFSAAFEDWLPEQELTVIDTNYLSKKAHIGFEKAMVLADNADILSREIKSTRNTILYLIFVCFSLIGVIFYSVIPEVISTTPLERWSSAQKAVYYLYIFMTEYSYILAPFLILATYLIKKSIPVWTGDLRFNFDKWPPYSFYKLMMGASFITSVDAMLSSGMSLKFTLEHIHKSSKSKWLKERIKAAMSGVNTGEENLGSALSVSGYEFPDEDSIIKMQTIFNNQNSAGSLSRFSEYKMKKTLEDMQRKGLKLKIWVMFGFAFVFMTICIVMYDLIKISFFRM